jgi:NADP-dependent 3-hydroxy acid dehydrogenase YdfG
LGKAMTKYFLELGAKVAITSRDLEKLKTQLPNLKQKQAELVFLYNVMFVTEVEKEYATKRTTSLWKVDVLLNNAAGISFHQRSLICKCI